MDKKKTKKGDEDKHIPHTTDKQRERLDTWLASEFRELTAAAPYSLEWCMELFDCVPSTPDISDEDILHAYKALNEIDQMTAVVLNIWSGVLLCESKWYQRLRNIYSIEYTEKALKRSRKIMRWTAYEERIRNLIFSMDTITIPEGINDDVL